MWSQWKQNNDAVLQRALWCIHLSSNCINELLFCLDPSLKEQNGRHQWTFFNTILHLYIKPPKISYSNIYTITIYIVSLPKTVNHILWAPCRFLSAHILLHVGRCYGGPQQTAERRNYWSSGTASSSGPPGSVVRYRNHLPGLSDSIGLPCRGCGWKHI